MSPRKLTSAFVLLLLPAIVFAHTIEVEYLAIPNTIPSGATASVKLLMPPPSIADLPGTVVHAHNTFPRVTGDTGVHVFRTDGTPYPVLFQLTGPITAPDGTTLDVMTTSDGTIIHVDEARLAAVATGSETDNRVSFRLTHLAIRGKDGRRGIMKVDGWIIEKEDGHGLRGIKGESIDKLFSEPVFLTVKLKNGTEANILNPSESKGVLKPVIKILPGREGVAIFTTAIE